MTAPMTQVRELLHELVQSADCSRRRVGCVLVYQDRIVGVGHNRLPTGSCLAGACPRGQMSYEEQPKDVGYAESGCTSIHAEVMAITNAGLFAEHSRAYVTEWPCPQCSDALVEAGVAEVVVV